MPKHTSSKPPVLEGYRIITDVKLNAPNIVEARNEFKRFLGVGASHRDEELEVQSIEVIPKASGLKYLEQTQISDPEARTASEKTSEETHERLIAIIQHLYTEHGLSVGCEAVTGLRWISRESLEGRVTLGNIPKRKGEM